MFHIYLLESFLVSFGKSCSFFLCRLTHSSLFMSSSFVCSYIYIYFSTRLVVKLCGSLGCRQVLGLHCQWRPSSRRPMRRREILLFAEWRLLLYSLGRCLCRRLVYGQCGRLRYEHGTTCLVVFGTMYLGDHVLFGMATPRITTTLGRTTSAENRRSNCLRKTSTTAATTTITIIVRSIEYIW